MAQVQDVEARVKEIIVEQLGVDASEVNIQASFVNDLGADSLDTVELVMALEEEFGTSKDGWLARARSLLDSLEDARAKLYVVWRLLAMRAKFLSFAS